MTLKQITNYLKIRGYILESDYPQELTLTSTSIEKYNDKNSKVFVDKTNWTYALYNPKKFTEEQIEIRLKYKRDIAKYLCKKAKNSKTIHYQDFNQFLNQFNLDYFLNNDIKYLIEEISTDFKRITNGAVLTAVLITKEGIPSDGFWTLADIANRSKGLDQKTFHQAELIRLSKSLKNFDCCD